jgi:uncharacterized protein YdaU (DUF1376 family)
VTPHQDLPGQIEVPYLAICGWDIERWQSSRAYRRMSLAAQGAYLNLCFSAWKHQPSCVLPLDDRELWRLANAPTRAAWEAVKAEVFDTDAWTWSERGWLNEVVLETYVASAERHRAAVRSGRIAGRASARARRAMSQASRIKEDGTAVERPLNDRQPAVTSGSTIVNPPSPSPSPSPTTTHLPKALRPGAEGPPASPPDADSWDLPPGLGEEPPSPAASPPIAGRALTAALNRLVAGEVEKGREVSRQVRLKLRERLRDGRPEADLAKQLEAQAEKRRTENADTVACEEALAWIAGHGGTASVVNGAHAWLKDHPVDDDMDIQAALRQWANQAHAPPRVVTYVLPSIHQTHRRAG